MNRELGNIQHSSFNIQHRMGRSVAYGRILTEPPPNPQPCIGTPRLRGSTEELARCCRLKAAFRWFRQDASGAYPWALNVECWALNVAVASGGLR